MSSVDRNAVVIDIHAHAFPDELAERALTTLVNNCGVQPCTDGTCDGLCKSMRSAGIDKSVVMPIATKPTQVRTINDWAVAINQGYNNLICFGTLHPKQDDWLAEIDRLVASGILGVKFHPDYQGFFVDDPELLPIYQALADASLVVLFHAGMDIGLPPPVHCTPERLAHAMDAVPDLKIIAAHMGGYQCWDDVMRYLMGRDLYFDTSFSIADLGPDQMTELIKAHGTERILFGTDSPWTDQSLEIKAIRALPFTAEEIAAVLGGNALNLLQQHTN